MPNAVTGLDEKASKWVKKNRVELQDLPDPTQEWTVRDVPYTHQRVKKFNTQGLVNDVGQTREQGRWWVNVYRTTQRGYEAIQAWNKWDENNSGLLPCDHDGFSNLGNGMYQCARKGCGEIHTRKEIEANE